MLTSSLLLLSLCSAEPPATGNPGSDWPGFLGPQGTSVSTETGIVAPWPKEGLKAVWQLEVGTGYGMPAVSRGRLFHFDRREGKARLRCLKSRTGDHLWTFEYPTAYKDRYSYNNGPRCCPVVDGDRVYLFGAEGMLHCLGAEDGKLVWKCDTQAEFGVLQNFFGVGSAPVIEGDLLIVQVGGSPAGVEFDDMKANGSAVVAFDKLTGKIKYKVGDDLASYASPVLASINGQRRCFVFARSGLLALDPAAGKVLFHFPWRARSYESVNASNPVVVGDRVFITECYGPGSALLQLKGGDCEVVWSDARKTEDKSLQCHWNTPIHHDGFLYASSGRHEKNAELRCIELATGKVAWTQPGLTRTSLLMVDGHFICLGEDGQLRLLKVNSQKYEEIARMEVPRSKGKEDYRLHPCWAAPVLSHGLLYVLCADDKLACLELIPEKR